MAILEKIKIIIEEDGMLDYVNVYGEKTHDYIFKNEIVLKAGNIYGIICEQGAGGEGISQLLTNNKIHIEKNFFIDETETKDIYDISWYVGKPILCKNIMKKELSVQKALEYAIKKYNRYTDIDSILEEFHLSQDKINYGLTNNTEWEKWRASFAIGYASKKKIYCFPWMDSMFFYDCMYNSSVFRFFKKITKENGIIILPTSREQNVRHLADVVIKLKCNRFEHCIADTEYFKKYF